MAKNDIYTITMLKWDDHNPNRKRTYKYTLIANNLYDHYKLRAMPVTHRWLYIVLLLMCGDHNRDTIELTERQLRDHLESSKSVSRALETLQSFQLVKYQKKSALYNRIEENRIEENRIEVPATKSRLVVDKDLTAKIWTAFKDAYLLKYKVEPTRNARVNSQISHLAKRLGQDAVPVVQFYLAHNDSFYIQKAHAIGLCLHDAESLRTQWLRGQQITRSAIKRFEKAVEANELIESIRKDGI